MDFIGDGYSDIAVQDQSGVSTVLLNSGNETFQTGVSATGSLFFVFNYDGVFDIAQGGTVRLAGAKQVNQTKHLNLLTQSDARNELTFLKTQQEKISSQIGALGATQSRFETAIAVLTAKVTNVTAARSRILDADVAEEAGNLARTQILQQTAIAVLSQANQSPKLALKLLQG